MAEKEGFLASEPVETSAHSSLPFEFAVFLPLLALLFSSAGRSRARPPRDSVARVQTFSIKSKKSKPKGLLFLLAEKDYASQIASFFSQYQLLLK